MSDICACPSPLIDRSGSGELYCKHCGAWWKPELGSVQAGPAAAPKRVLQPLVRAYPPLGRNERCPCGSGLKVKRCCGPKFEQPLRTLVRRA